MRHELLHAATARLRALRAPQHAAACLLAALRRMPLIFVERRHIDISPRCALRFIFAQCDMPLC